MTLCKEHPWDPNWHLPCAFFASPVHSLNMLNYVVKCYVTHSTDPCTRDEIIMQKIVKHQLLQTRQIFLSSCESFSVTCFASRRILQTLQQKAVMQPRRVAVSAAETRWPCFKVAVTLPSVFPLTRAPRKPSPEPAAHMWHTSRPAPLTQLLELKCDRSGSGRANVYWSIIRFCWGVGAIHTYPIRGAISTDFLFSTLSLGHKSVDKVDNPFVTTSVLSRCQLLPGMLERAGAAYFEKREVTNLERKKITKLF